MKKLHITLPAALAALLLTLSACAPAGANITPPPSQTTAATSTPISTPEPTPAPQPTFTPVEELVYSFTAPPEWVVEQYGGDFELLHVEEWAATILLPRSWAGNYFLQSIWNQGAEGFDLAQKDYPAGDPLGFWEKDGECGYAPLDSCQILAGFVRIPSVLYYEKYGDPPDSIYYDLGERDGWYYLMDVPTDFCGVAGYDAEWALFDKMGRDLTDLRRTAGKYLIFDDEPPIYTSGLEPPLDGGDLLLPVPEFLTEEQQDLYRRAHSAYIHVFGPDSWLVEYPEFPLKDDGSNHDTIEYHDFTYHRSEGRYRRWADFDAMLHSLFTDEFIQSQSKIAGEIYIERDGYLYFMDVAMGDDNMRNYYFPDTFELLEQTGDTIRFHVVGYYSDGYPQEYEVTPDGEWDYAARDERLRNGYEYERRYEIVLLRTPEGWRFDTFFDTAFDHE